MNGELPIAVAGETEFDGTTGGVNARLYVNPDAERPERWRIGLTVTDGYGATTVYLTPRAADRVIQLLKATMP